MLLKMSLDFYLNCVIHIIILSSCVQKSLTWGTGSEKNPLSTEQTEDENEDFKSVDFSLYQNRYIQRPDMDADVTHTIDLARRTIGNNEGENQNVNLNERNRKHFLSNSKSNEKEYIIERSSSVNNITASESVLESKKDEIAKRFVSTSKEVTETQQATCQVTTEELVATAQATVTRVLKGLCNAKKMEERIQNLEMVLIEKLNMIKATIMNLEDKLTDQEVNIKNEQQALFGSLTRQCNGGNVNSNTKGNGEIRVPRPLKENGYGNISFEKEESIETVADGPREMEIVKYNSTLSMEPNMNGRTRKVFTYYWRINNMANKLKGWSSRRSVRSQSFYIYAKGYRMYLRIYPRTNDVNFSVYVGITKGEFDETLKWPFQLKHKVLILDQTKGSTSFEDIASRVWDPSQLCSEFNWQKPTKGDNYECVGLGFPQDLLKQRDYIYADSIVIKLIVYLENI